jgi:hypothetical protein
MPERGRERTARDLAHLGVAVEQGVTGAAGPPALGHEPDEHAGALRRAGLDRGTADEVGLLREGDHAAESGLLGQDVEAEFVAVQRHPGLEP